MAANVHFRCTKDHGISIGEMDSAHVAIVLLFLSTQTFDKNYKCEKDIVIGVDLNNLKKSYPKCRKRRYRHVERIGKQRYHRYCDYQR